MKNISKVEDVMKAIKEKSAEIAAITKEKEAASVPLCRPELPKEE